ncbi:aminoglycoside adenylyltransferase domain-containing protein [Halobacillus sp. BBL2006]|uniref:aminoglycoside adenylyltransferase domain-containing protein n=1 Tax=Halobacillus sp. BBL2006 TaxID=1543706 RepID=UPI000542EFE4|nr:aminoglycoside adenylyltransferase domain-containing protein [Halobacillus sp. BBL2006]KHE71405.1 hypothetical protein LD39_09975 [Halobacillus sp. BBL2006]
MPRWNTSSFDEEEFVSELLEPTKAIIKENFIGLYLHGSLAMGGFNRKSSDVDVLVVTEKGLDIETKRQFAQLCLTLSKQPFPLELSMLSRRQLLHWEHPSPFEFHFSEFWRERYEKDLAQGTCQYINDHQGKDPDLAAHVTITNHRGICIEGPPISSIFPSVPSAHYASSILADYHSCIEELEEDPVYCVLNIVRVYWYLKEGEISSKQEAGKWGMENLPEIAQPVVHQAYLVYKNGGDCKFEQKELSHFKNYMKAEIGQLQFMM